MQLHVSVVLAQIHPSSRLVFSGRPDRFTGLLVISNTVKLRRQFTFESIQSKSHLLLYDCNSVCCIPSAYFFDSFLNFLDLRLNGRTS